MSALISKSRSKKSKQRDKEDRKRAAKRRVPVTAVLIGILIWASALAIIHIGRYYRHSLLSVGQRAPQTVISVADFKTVDLARTEMNRRAAAEGVLPVFRIREAPLRSAYRTYDKLFERVAEWRETQQDKELRRNNETALNDFLELLEIPLRADELNKLIPEEREQELLELLKNSLQTVWQQGIISQDEKDSLFQGIVNAGAVNLVDAESANPTEVSIDDILTPEESTQAVVEMVLKDFDSRHRLNRTDLGALLKPWVGPNLQYDAQKTSALREQAKKKVQPATMTVPAGTKLVEAGARITQEAQAQLRAHETRLQQMESPVDRLFRIIGDGSLLLMALILCVGLMQVMKPEALRDVSQLTILLVLALFVLVPAKLLIYLTATTNWMTPDLVKFVIPIAITSLLATILLDVSVALIAGIWTSFAAAMLLGHNFPMFSIGLLISAVAAHAAEGVHRRSRIFRAGLWVALAEILAVITWAVIADQALPAILIQSGAALVNGLLCAVIAILLIPLFELLFGVTTDITLLELTDMGNPLLQRMAMEAPGTYHHSLMVANLAQAAAQEIGAHGLQVRVAAYYHDIGKLTKPEFFIENAQFRDNPHDDLSPSMSTLVVTSHVKEGVTLALRHKLPRIVVDAIQQHHGSGLVSYFYHRAREQKKVDPSSSGTANGEVKEGDYRYPGPKPQSREMAILALADSVEAASRSIDKPTPSRIENLVREIVRGKLTDGQLDDTPLTMAELSAIQRAFVFTLTNMLHGRIAYPKDDSRSKQQPDKTSDRPADDTQSSAMDNAAGTKS